MSSSSLKEGKMLYQPRLSTAIKRATLALLSVCLFGTLTMAAPQEPLTAPNAAASMSSQGVASSANSMEPAKVAAAPAQQAAPMASPTPAPGMSSASGKAQQSDQGKRYGEFGFVGEPINLNVVNADIRDILNYITEQYGVNFVIDSSVAAVPVTVNVSDVPWNVALDAVLKANRLSVEVSGNILRVATTEVLTNESVSQRVLVESRLQAAPLVTEFIRLNYACGSDEICKQQGGNFKGGVTAFDTAYTTTGSGRDYQTQKLSTSGGGIQPIIQKRLSRRGSVEVDASTNTLIITDVKENIEAIRQLVTLLDQPEPQVEIETRIVIANRNFSRDLGVQLNALAINNQTGGTAGYGTAPGTPLVGGTGTTTGNPIGLRPPGIPQGIQNATGALGANLASTVIGLTTGMIGTAQISALITAAETRGTVKIIATPRVTTLNNRTAEISSGQQIPVTTPQTGAGGTGSVLVFTTTFVPVPLRLVVTPRITDAGTVILHVVAENNTVNTAIAVNGTPGIDTQKMETYVLVPDGGTTVVGGVLGDNESETQNRTPGMASIPVLGNLFKRKLVTRQSNEILFFITPRIYRPDYQGKPTTVANRNGNRSTTISQPVPMGNPQTNTPTTQQVEQQQQLQQPVVAPAPSTTVPASPRP
jgi:type IV pilus assembly protein PilQ